MSEAESFLSRWARRKSEPGKEDPAPGNRTPPLEDAREPAAQVASVETPFDPESLPSIESITAETDISPFLKPNVPAELSRAALRQLWVADPAIRDFVGLAENAWDFTKPDGVPGFGPLAPKDIARLAADLLANMSQPSQGGAQNEVASADLTVPENDAARSQAAQAQQPVETQAQESREAASTDEDDAPQQEIVRREEKFAAAPRPHGSALPK